jgi:hypothetical protein
MNKDNINNICLFSEPNFLAINILKDLIQSNFSIVVVTNDKNGWVEKTSTFLNRDKFVFIKINQFKEVHNFSYIIFLDGFNRKEFAAKNFKVFILNNHFEDAKVLAIFPFDLYKNNDLAKISINKNAGILFLGDLFGQQIDLKSNLTIPRLFNEIYKTRSITLGIGETFYPMLASLASKVIVRNLKTQGFFGKKSFLLGPKITSSDFWKACSKIFNGLKIYYDISKEIRDIPTGYEIRRVNSNLKDLLLETIKQETEEVPVKEVTVKKTKKPVKTENRKINIKYFRQILLAVFAIFAIPFLTIITSVVLLIISYKFFLINNIDASANFAKYSKFSLNISQSESRFLSRIPIINKVYRETLYISEIGTHACDVVVNSIPLIESSKDLLNSVLSNKQYDPQPISVQLKSGLDYIYQQISVIEVLTQGDSDKGVLLAKQVLNLVDFNKYKDICLRGSELLSGLPSFLGEGKNKKYLILFQNNMELRPTGGFIGSYGIVDFGGGKMNGLTINDIYSADGQLKGHVEPPTPIRKYLNEANWFFRDSNWDPDFTTSSKRAEWFLSKEMDQQVDGVIAFDLQPIKDILYYIGPIFLPDYNLTITSENLYEKTQEEAQANFFPGSRKKASFLTALSRVLLTEIEGLSLSKKLLVLRSLYENLDERHIQLYLHDESLQDPINKLSWDGGIPVYSCGEKCYSDFYGVVEANVGVNKSNYFVSRKEDFNVIFGNTDVSRDLKITLNNSANLSLGPSGIYKTYLRLMVPLESNIVSAKVTFGQSNEILPVDITDNNGRREVGVYLEIPPNAAKTVQFLWTSNLEDKSTLKSYGLYIRKQAGTLDDKLSLSFKSNRPIVSSQPILSLTSTGYYTYNTVLGKDFFARFVFK